MPGYRTLAVVFLLMIAPATLHAVGMGNMGGMGGMGGAVGMVDKIEIQTQDVGTVVFRHSVHGTRCNECHPKLFKKQSNSKLKPPML